MRNLYTNHFFSLQLFGEENSGETGVDAALGKGETGEGAPSQTNGEQPPTREQTFESLITGEYKDLYENRVSHIVQKRLGKNKTDAKRLEGLETFVNTLSGAYGVENTTDLSALEQAILGKKQEPCNTHVLADSVYQDLLSQAEALKTLYPSFNVQKELENPKFSTLMRVPGMDMQTAFELTHKEEILPAVIAAAGKEAEIRIAKSLASGGLRPPENGTAAQSANLARSTVSTFSAAQMDDICKRVSRGEKIYL